jgi:ParB-like chromosome segregation protein Spo0J
MELHLIANEALEFKEIHENGETTMNLFESSLIEKGKELAAEIAALDPETAITVLNEIRQALHEASPMRDEPVDCVLWVKNDSVEANDYNPNSVAPPEMKLLAHSISEDGYTQPIVAWGTNGYYEVIDGFHRNRVGKEDKAVCARVRGYLPITLVKADRQDLNDRMASTIRHNRARGKHKVDAMSEIVQDLARRNWNDQKIAKELGMEPDEVLRLKQISGLAELFADRDFSEAWEASYEEVEPCLE